MESELMENTVPSPLLSFLTCAPTLNLVSTLLNRSKHTKLSMHPENDRKHFSLFLIEVLYLIMHVVKTLPKSRLNFLLTIINFHIKPYRLDLKSYLPINDL